MKRKTIIIVIFFLIISLSTVVTRAINKDVSNAKTYLHIPTTYKSPQATHPSLVSFKKRWHGFKYWLAYTPYEHADSNQENPSIIASNDLVNWVMPKNINNPLDTVYDIHKKNYNSDPDLIYNPTTNNLELIWRTVIGNTSTYYLMSSPDGSTWSDKKAIFSLDRTKIDMYSPAIVLEDGTYRIWSVSIDYKVKYIESNDLINWSKPQEIDVRLPENVYPWHIDAQKIDGQYHLLINGFKKQGPNLAKQRYNGSSLYLTTSLDNKVYTPAKKIIEPSKNGFDNKGLYRSTINKINDGYVIIYSTVSRTGEWHISLSLGKDLENLVGYKQPSFKKAYKNLFKIHKSQVQRNHN